MTAFFTKLAATQLRHPGAVALVFAVLATLGIWRAAHLTVVTDFADLLSPDQPSVVELHRVIARARGLSNVFVVLEGSDSARLRAHADHLLPKLRALGSPTVDSAASGVQEARRFLMPRAGLFLSDDRLDKLRQELREQERRAFRQRIGADLDDDAPPPLEDEKLRNELTARLGSVARYPDGYFQGPSPLGTAVIVVVKSAIVVGDLTGAREAVKRISQTVAAASVQAGPAAKGIRIGYAGDLVTGLEEYGQVRADVTDVGLFGLGLVLGVLLLFFRSLPAIAALGGAILAGCALTFGVAEMTLGHLNVASAFLFSIVAGNGINFGIIWLARYSDERRQGQSVAGAVERALALTYGPTLGAACAAAAAYATLGISRFGAFRHFAVIGAAGMLLCWATSYALLPALVVLLERRRRGGDGTGRMGSVFATRRAPFELPFTWVATHAPGATVVGALVVSALALLLGGRYLHRGPLEYDMRRMQSDPTSTEELYRISAVAARIVGANTEGAMVLLTDDVRDTPALVKTLRHVRDSAPAGQRPFEEVHALDDFVPPRQQQRLASLQRFASDLRRLHERGAFDDSVWDAWAPLLPPDDLRPFGVDDLPSEITALFTEKDGTRGRIVYIEPTEGEIDSDLHYLLRWADAFRQTRLPDGRVIHGSGRAVIFADLLSACLVDMPRVLALSLVLTCVAVALLFRRARAIALVLGSLAMALLWLLGALAATNVRLNFINLIALPITFGIGIDYAVNIYGRYQQDPSAGIIAAVRGSGGAVVLCSLTTCLGYLALLRAHNQAVRSLGAVAVLGELTCLLTAVLVLPAVIVWSDRQRQRRRNANNC